MTPVAAEERVSRTLQVGVNAHGTCRFCGTALVHTVVDLGTSPLCESYVPAERLNDMEAFYPLRVFLCDQCFLVQLPAHVSGEEIFTEYAYFSSYSTSWLAHCRRLRRGDDRTLRPRRGEPGRRSREQRRLSAAVLRRARHPGAWASSRPPMSPRPRIERGIPTAREVLRAADGATSLLRDGTGADLLIGNNVLAQVPDLNDFVAGLKILLQAEAVSDPGVSASDAADRGEPVRHHLPRALLLLLVRRRSSGSSPRTA